MVLVRGGRVRISWRSLSHCAGALDSAGVNGRHQQRSKYGTKHAAEKREVIRVAVRIDARMGHWNGR